MYEAASSSKSAASAAYNKLIGLGKTTRFKSYYTNITRGKQAWIRDACKSFEVNFLSSSISRHMDCMAKATDLRSPTPLQLVIRRVAPNCSISMEKAQEWVWHLVLSLSYPHQTLSDI